MASHTCPECSGTLEFIGALGLLRHFRCRSCGMMFNRKVRNVHRKVRGYGSNPA
jgi:tRNA(Ile2) C34 agmatinyltransferase TiaS